MVWTPVLRMVLLLGIAQGAASIELLRRQINATVVRGSSLTLICKVDSQGQVIYQAKWYKDGEEFYQLTPNKRPQVKLFPVNGTNVDEERSDLSQVTLENVSLETAGKYGCEITAEGTFNTVTDTGTVTVVELPRDDPQILHSDGRRRDLISRDVADVVSVECVSAQSWPAANLSWFINDEQTSRQTTTRYPVTTDAAGLQTSTLGLTLLLRETHFRNGQVTLRCVSQLYNVYYASAMVKIHQMSLAQRSPQTSGPTFTSGSRRTTLEPCFRLIVIGFGMLLLKTGLIFV